MTTSDIDSQTRAVTEIFGEALLEVDAESQAPLREAFDKVAALLNREDRGWQAIYGGGTPGAEADQFGLNLAQLKDWGRKIRESIVGAPWIKAGFNRRQQYIWQNDIRYGNIPGQSRPTRGTAVNVQQIIDRPENQRAFFSPSARRSTEECLFAEGIAFWIGNEATKDLQAIPLRQITDQLLEPSGLGYAIAYKREWTEFNIETGKHESHARWYFTDRDVSRRVQRIRTSENGPGDEVDQNHVIFDFSVNGSTGLVYGAPDAVAAFIWNGIVRDAVMDGRAVTKSLATFALKAQVKSEPGGKNAAMKLADTKGAGNTAIVGQANDLTAMASAGKGYDFTSLRFLVAIVAASLDISVIHLTANPGDAGSSYGSAQVLDLPTRLAMEERRRDHVELNKRILRWMGVKDPDVTFVPYDASETTYRTIQGIALALTNGIIDRQEFRDIFDDLLGRSNGSVPDPEDMYQVVLAQALAEVESASTDGEEPADDQAATDGTDAASAVDDQASTALPQTASPNQGQSNGTGGQAGGSASNDLRAAN